VISITGLRVCFENGRSEFHIRRRNFCYGQITTTVNRRYWSLRSLMTATERLTIHKVQSRKSKVERCAERLRPKAQGLFLGFILGCSQYHLAVAGGCEAKDQSATASSAPTRYREVVLTACNLETKPLRGM